MVPTRAQLGAPANANGTPAGFPSAIQDYKAAKTRWQIFTVLVIGATMWWAIDRDEKMLARRRRRRRAQ